MAMSPDALRQHNENIMRFHLGPSVLDPGHIKELYDTAKKCLQCGEPHWNDSKAFCSAECCRKHKAENKMTPAPRNPNKRKKRKKRAKNR